MIDLSPLHLATVKDVLHDLLPGVEVSAFGSRTREVHKKHADLDLALQAAQPLHWQHLARLREAFEESDLPFRVAVVDWAACSAQFKAHASPLVGLVP